MSKKVLMKIAAFLVLSVFIISAGMVSFAKAPGGEVAGINWTYIDSCGYSFYITRTTTNYDYVYIMGSTGVTSQKYAYVQIQLQRYKDGGWQNFGSALSDEDYMMAAVEPSAGEVRLDPGYTYRLKIVHKCKASYGGTVLETYTEYSSNTIVSPSR